MALLNLFAPTLAGLARVLTAANVAGDSFPLPGPIIVTINNGSGAPINVTFVGSGVCSQGFLHNAVLAVAAGATVDVYVADLARFADVNGRLQLTYSDVTTLTVGAYRAA